LAIEVDGRSGRVIEVLSRLVSGRAAPLYRTHPSKAA
jgi:hypothetical protein